MLKTIKDYDKQQSSSILPRSKNIQKYTKASFTDIKNSTNLKLAKENKIASKIYHKKYKEDNIKKTKNYVFKFFIKGKK